MIGARKDIVVCSDYVVGVAEVDEFEHKGN